MTAVLRASWVWVAVGAWGVACGAAFCTLWSYANTPGAEGGLRPGWEPPRQLGVPGDRPTLIVFAHPKCPCTRATISELERLQADAPGAFATRMVFFEPVEADDSWRTTDLWRRARRLPDAEALADPGGVIATEAGAAISGCVALLGANGALQFWGGITSARGHEGDSVGSIALRAILRGHEPGRRRAEVYGCELLGSEAAPVDCADGGECDAPPRG